LPNCQPGSTRLKIRQYGVVAAEVIRMGRKARGRIADLMIASIAAANRLPLLTTNPADFQGLESVVTVVPVPIPPDGHG
jgi:predicted nucleic acid-binding protein